MKPYLQGIVATLAVMGMIATLGTLSLRPAHAQAQPGMSWSGKVEGNAVVTIHHRHANTHEIKGRHVTHISVHFWSRLPDAPVRVSLVHWQGRGDVRLIQQPRPDNNFTAIVQVNDPQPGEGKYSFTLGW
jgi:hypothetical protein